VLLEISEKHKTGWYLFNLMISGYWGEVHGLFYPDGTIRDPAIIAAVMGFYRNDESPANYSLAVCAPALPARLRFTNRSRV